MDISQQELSNLLNMSVDSVRSMEINRAKPSIETLEKLTDLFHVSADYLLGKESWDEMVSDLQKELIDVFPKLPSDDQEVVLELIRKLINKGDQSVAMEVKKINLCTMKLKQVKKESRNPTQHP